MSEELERLANWCDAYPTNVFIPPPEGWVPTDVYGHIGPDTYVSVSPDAFSAHVFRHMIDNGLRPAVERIEELERDVTHWQERYEASQHLLWAARRRIDELEGNQ